MESSSKLNEKSGARASALRVGEAVSLERGRGLAPVERIKNELVWQSSDLFGQRYRIKLYRFLTEQVPIINACIWTWVRLSAAQGGYRLEDNGSAVDQNRAENVLDLLQQRIFANRLGQRVGLTTMMPDLYTGLFRDGFYGGFLTVRTDGSGVDQFIPIDPCYLTERENRGVPKLLLETENRQIDLNRPDFYYLSLGDSQLEPLGGSVLRAIPFVSYIEQQLVNDMRRSSHNSGFHRLHVKITPPERMAGESDKGYVDRTNAYFDDTVRMIRDCDVDDNPVTWDNVAVEYIGPNANAGVSSAWFMNHRAMIEDICAGTNLAPYLLGYSYGATTTWSGFKFDVVMRQVHSVQAQVSRFLEWIGNIELALAGVKGSCRYNFDNSLSYQALDKMKIESSRVENLLKLYQAGLIDKERAAERAERLI